jgi:hypothetical protein
MDEKRKCTLPALVGGTEEQPSKGHEYTIPLQEEMKRQELKFRNTTT